MAWPRRQGLVEEEECGLSTAPAMAIGCGFARCRCWHRQVELADMPAGGRGDIPRYSTTPSAG